ncbi:MAG: cytochrome c-type biogenesis protein CcmH [Chloroflexi bacterium OLB15]|nr:MAG: cytochrome c-type biogenesis protein CcmH [Chloroflexi bacterium OLB15]
MKRLILVVLALFGLFAGIMLAAAQDTGTAVDPSQITDDQVMEVARSLYCPVCPNEPLNTCQTEACYRWREDIRSQLARGLSKDQIIANFVAQYGERASAVPLDQTLQTVSLVTPFLIAGVALLIAIFLILRWRGAKTAAPTGTVNDPSASVPPDDPYRAALEDDVKG